MTTVAELQPKQGKVDIVLEIVDKKEPREFDKFGKKGKVCNAQGKDETGEITLSLWNEQVDMVDVGQKVKITNGYVSEYQGEKQLSTGKFGKLEIISQKENTTPKVQPALAEEKQEATLEEAEENELPIETEIEDVVDPEAEEEEFNPEKEWE